MAAEAIVIGASAGALEALSAILPFLPANYSLPVMIDAMYKLNIYQFMLYRGAIMLKPHFR